jgi:hypothetical protein
MDRQGILARLQLVAFSVDWLVMGDLRGLLRQTRWRLAAKTWAVLVAG